MKRFSTDRYKDCRRCHKMVGIMLIGTEHHVTCSVDDKDMGKARVPSYCPRKQMAGKKEKKQ